MLVTKPLGTHTSHSSYTSCADQVGKIMLGAGYLLICMHTKN